MIGDVIYSLLSNDATVSALVSTRIYPNIAIANVVYPYIVYEQTGNSPQNDKDGKSTIDTLTYNIEIYTETLAESNDLGLKVRNVLDRYTGTVSGKVIQSVKYSAENNGYSDDMGRVHLKMQSYDFRFMTIYSYLSKITDLAGVKVSTTEIALSWSNVATGNAGYEVWRSIDAINWTYIATTAQDATSYNNTGLTSATAYIYKIRATDGTNGGEWSNIVSVATDGGTVASGIQYNRDYFTLQTTSYAIYDDGYQFSTGTNMAFTNPTNPLTFATLDLTTDATGNTLLENNSFGNKIRLTTEAGVAPAVINGQLIVDNYTGLSYWDASQSKMAWNSVFGAGGHLETFNTNLTGGYNDFFNANYKASLSVAQMETYNSGVQDALMLPYLKSANLNTWTSTSRQGASTQANYLHVQGFYGIINKTTTSITPLYCRVHFKS